MFLRIGCLWLAISVLLSAQSHPTLLQQTKQVTGAYRPIGFVFTDTTVGLTYFFAPGVDCTIFNWRGVVQPSGASVTMDVWKLNGAYPTVANSIVGLTPPVISGTAPIVSTNVAGWIKTVTPEDTFGFNIKAASTTPKPTQASLVLGCVK